METVTEDSVVRKDKERSKTDNEFGSKSQKEKKIGHRRVDATTGLTTYKKTPASALSCAIQLGISHTVGGSVSKPERDVLLQDFQVVETTLFPSEGSNITPAHHYNDFRFKTYAPVAFRYFRDLFGILPADFMLSISAEPLTELSNPGASGSLFFVTHDDNFIIKTVQHREAEFLQKLLPGYYMNLVQNPRTLLPKFYGLYCIQASGKNIRIVVMNNLLPRHLKMHLKFDLKGSTFKRKASKYEREKNSPTFKDLDILSDLPDGIVLEQDVFAAFMKTMQRDCLVLRSFKIMDYSLLLGVHFLDKDKVDIPSTEGGYGELEFSTRIDCCSPSSTGEGNSGSERNNFNCSNSSTVVNEEIEIEPSYVKTNPKWKQNTTSDSIASSTLLRDKYSNDFELWSGGIPALSVNGEKLLLFCGIIDILQCYKLKKKLEHTLKSMVYDSDSVSVHRPGFYCDRFQKFMSENVFKKSQDPLKIPTTKRKLPTMRKSFEVFNQPATSGLQSSVNQSHKSASTNLRSNRPDILPCDSKQEPLSNRYKGKMLDDPDFQTAVNRISDNKFNISQVNSAQNFNEQQKQTSIKFPIKHEESPSLTHKESMARGVPEDVILTKAHPRGRTVYETCV